MSLVLGNVKTIVKRELLTYFSSPVAYIFLIIFLVLTAFFPFNVSHFFEYDQASLEWFFRWHPWLYLILVPAIGMRLWSEDRRDGTLEVLFTLPVAPGEAIAGKFLAGWLFLGCALVLTFPMVITVNLLGNPDNGVILSGYIGSFLVAGTYLAFSSFTSAMTRNQVISFITAVALCMLMVLAGWPPITNMLPNFLVGWVAGFSVMPHFQTMQRGVVDLENVFFFLSMMAFALLATGAVLNSRRST